MNNGEERGIDCLEIFQIRKSCLSVPTVYNNETQKVYYTRVLLPLHVVQATDDHKPQQHFSSSFFIQVDVFAAIYKKLTGKDVTFEFPQCE